ncbi:MAG TPA: HIT domain-containing protein, partial [Kiritimatiellia bacterium]|nr:HIT domain-containing protein [Kiritimatiellia bacterium]
MTDPECVFCRIIAGQIPAKVLFENEEAIAFLDIAPFEPGHALVVPKM